MEEFLVGPELIDQKRPKEPALLFTQDMSVGEARSWLLVPGV
jgi:hypothetical protein